MAELFKDDQIKLFKKVDKSGNININVSFQKDICKAEVDILYETISSLLHRRYATWLELYNIENYENNYPNSRLENFIDNCEN